MQQKMIINLNSNVSMSNFKNGDILVYDATKKEFYTTTAESFFNKHRVEVEQLKETYNKVLENYKKEKEELEQEVKNFELKIQESNQKLIEMVENFIKGEN